MNKKAIAILLDSAPITWTSQEDRQVKLCEALVARNVQPILVFSERLKPEFEERLEKSGAVLAAINYGKGGWNYLRQLRLLVRKHQITTAHIIFFDYFSAVPWIAKLAGIKTIIYEQQNSGEFRSTSWKKILLRLRTKLATAPMTRVIAISEFVKQQLVRCGFAEDKIVVRYLGVDTDRFVPDKSQRKEWAGNHNVADKELILSTVSYLRPFKNPQVLVEMCSELAQRNVPARLFVAGNGDLLPSLRAQSEQLRVADRIHWLGNVADPRSLLQASDVFVLASVGEAFGLVLAEAMACEVPIVGSRHGSFLEVVDDGQTGLLATPLNAGSFADAIETLANEPELRKKMATASLNRVREKFTVEKAVAETLAIYDRLDV